MIFFRMNSNETKEFCFQSMNVFIFAKYFLSENTKVSIDILTSTFVLIAVHV